MSGLVRVSEASGSELRLAAILFADTVGYSRTPQAANRILSAILALAISALAAGCSPEVGSDAWCENMAEKPKGDWTVNEAADYARHCLFR